jgi:hypothetical protein
MEYDYMPGKSIEFNDDRFIRISGIKYDVYAGYAWNKEGRMYKNIFRAWAIYRSDLLRKKMEKQFTSKKAANDAAYRWSKKYDR